MHLGTTSMEVDALGIGTWSWGDKGDWGFGTSYTEGDLREAFRYITSTGTKLFDTAEKYAEGDSERYLGKFIRESGTRVVVATKFSPTRWEIRRRDLFHALRNSCRRLGVQQIDLYQIHWPTRFGPVEWRMAAMADAIDEGSVRAAGVCNYSREAMLRAQEALAGRGHSLTSIQVEFSLTCRAPERNGILDACRDSSVTLIAYSPLAMGMLTGKYSPQHPPSGLRGVKYSAAFLTRLQTLLGVTREIGQQHGGKTVAQVALNWVQCKGALPIPGAKNRKQAEENLGALGWSLTDEEIQVLERASDRLDASPSLPLAG